MKHPAFLWVSVKDALPKKVSHYYQVSTTVLVWIKFPYDDNSGCARMGSYNYDTEKWEIHNILLPNNYKVTHWMIIKSPEKG